jgi:hypothetical protein
MSYDNLSSVSQNVLKFISSLPVKREAYDFIFVINNNIFHGFNQQITTNIEQMFNMLVVQFIKRLMLVVQFIKRLMLVVQFIKRLMLVVQFRHSDQWW